MNGQLRNGTPSNGSGFKIGEFATLMLVVAVTAEGFQLVVAQGNLQTRALGTSALALIALLIGLRFGRRLYQRERIRAVGWLPKNVTWHVDENGVRHAIVTQNSNRVVTVAIPGHIDPEDALTYVLVHLNEGRR
jgi:hypothetical protein